MLMNCRLATTEVGSVGRVGVSWFSPGESDGLEWVPRYEIAGPTVRLFGQ